MHGTLVLSGDGGFIYTPDGIATREDYREMLDASM
jgi:hypothetical protein